MARKLWSFPVLIQAGRYFMWRLCGVQACTPHETEENRTTSCASATSSMPIDYVRSWPLATNLCE